MDVLDGWPGAAAPGFLVDGQLLLDAGTIGSAIGESESAGIRWLLLSHSHLDHIKELPFLALTRYDAKATSLIVAGLPKTLETLRRHVFNDAIWPDFSKIGEPPILVFTELEPGRVESFGPYRVTAMEVKHSVLCAGFLVEGRDAAFIYVTDSKQTDAIWRIAAENRRVQTAIMDIAFPDRLRERAEKTGHYTPASAAADVRKSGRDIRVLAMHLHPDLVDEIVFDMKRAGMNAEVAEQSAVYVLSDGAPPVKKKS